MPIIVDSMYIAIKSDMHTVINVKLSYSVEKFKRVFFSLSQK